MVDPVSFNERFSSRDPSSNHDLDGSVSEDFRFSEEFANFGKREPIS